MRDHFVGKSYDIIRNDMIRELIDEMMIRPLDDVDILLKC